MTTRRPARKTTSKSTSKTSGATRSTRRTSSTHPTRRRQSRPATALGAAVGTIVVAFLLGAPWSVRIALIVLVLLGLAGYFVWTRKR